MTDSSGNKQAEYFFDPFGVKTALVETVPADFQYAGYYFHNRSGFCLTETRAYSATMGRFRSRDPAGESVGVNLYGYIDGDPLSSSAPADSAHHSKNAYRTTIRGAVSP